MFLPYCLIPVGDGRYVVANRDYKPLGTTEFVDYETHPATRRIVGLSKKAIAAISVHGDASNDGRIYLYNDGCVPTASKAHWEAYSQRLKALSGMSVE